VRASGLAALSLRDLARSVGMQPPSLYSYFESKNAIHDAMYAQGAQQFVDEQRASMPTPDDPVDALKAVVHFFVAFCASDFARYQLLFQRTIPGFELSPESFKISQDNLAELLATNCLKRLDKFRSDHDSEARRCLDDRRPNREAGRPITQAYPRRTLSPRSTMGPGTPPDPRASSRTLT
jgi:AcrR family transcriptional regulator